MCSLILINVYQRWYILTYRVDYVIILLNRPQYASKGYQSEHYCGG